MYEKFVFNIDFNYPLKKKFQNIDMQMRNNKNAVICLAFAWRVSSRY